jgi:hypothetical protein
MPLNTVSDMQLELTKSFLKIFLFLNVRMES